MLTRGVVLDLDDTLFLERDYVISGLVAVGAHLAATRGISGFTESAIGLFAGGVRGTTFNQALAAIGVSPTDALIHELVDVYRGHAPKIALLPDAGRLVERLDSRYVGVVTDGPLASQRAKAEAVDAPTWASLIVYTAELGPGYGKPHQRAFSMHESRAGMSGERFTYIADNPAKDFAGPKARDWATVRIRRPGSLHADRESGPDVDREIVSLDELTTAP